MDHIDTFFATATQNACYPISIRAALAIGKRTLNRYYNKTDHSEVYRIAMGSYLHGIICNYYWCPLVLHPRHKLHYFKSAGWEDEWIETARSIVREEFDRTYAFMDLDERVVSKNFPVWYFLFSKTYCYWLFLVFIICQYIWQSTRTFGPLIFRAPRWAWSILKFWSWAGHGRLPLVVWKEGRIPSPLSYGAQLSHYSRQVLQWPLIVWLLTSVETSHVSWCWTRF